MFDESDFSATAKFLKLGIKLYVTNPAGMRPTYASTFPTPKGATVTLDERSLYDVERKLRALTGNKEPLKTGLTPLAFLGTNYRAVVYFQKGVDEFVLMETHDLFGVETNKQIRKTESFAQLLS
jgi:hypothetical protein